MFKKKIYMLLAGAALLPAGIAYAQTTTNTLPAYADGAPVVLTGTIGDIRSDEFDLNYGTGKITVELDGWEWTGNETRYLSTGERITVSGRIDDDFFEGREVEADNIFLPGSYSYYYTTDVYPSYYWYYDENNAVQDGSYASMRGTVSNISGNEFTLTGANNTSMKVDVSDLGHDPFDDEGLQKVENGDRVHVYGEIDDGFFERREIMADSIVVLSQAGSTTQN